MKNVSKIAHMEPPIFSQNGIAPYNMFPSWGSWITPPATGFTHLHPSYAKQHPQSWFLRKEDPRHREWLPPSCWWALSNAHVPTKIPVTSTEDLEGYKWVEGALASKPRQRLQEPLCLPPFCEKNNTRTKKKLEAETFFPWGIYTYVLVMITVSGQKLVQDRGIKAFHTTPNSNWNSKQTGQLMSYVDTYLTMSIQSRPHRLNLHTSQGPSVNHPNPHPHLVQGYNLGRLTFLYRILWHGHGQDFS